MAVWGSIDQGLGLGRTRLAMWMESGGKHPGSSGFDSRRAHPLRVCYAALAACRLLRNRPTLLVLRIDSPQTHYCIVRQDLPRGVLAAQLIHAAGESAGGCLPPHTRAIALAVRDEAELVEVEQSLVRLGISHRAIREPDTPWCGALMAIGIAPVADRALVAPVTAKLRLLR